jgi:hypothetical protein
MRATRRLIVLVAALPCLAAGGCGSSDTIVASVAGTPIGSQQLARWTSVELAAGGDAGAAKRQALDLLIAWQWASGEARALGVTVTTSEARRQLGLSRINKNSGAGFESFKGESALFPFLDNPKVSAQDQLTLVRMGMLAARVGARHVASVEAALPSAAVLAYYRRNRGLFRIGERRDIRAIMNKDVAKVLEAKHEMERHVPFHQIEERFNTSIEGGLRLGRARGQQEKRYEKDYFAAPLHHLIGPRHEILYYVFEVMAVHPGRQRTLQEAEATIRRRLAARGPIVAAQRAYEQRWRARTICRTGFSSSRCGSFGSKI